MRLVAVTLVALVLAGAAFADGIGYWSGHVPKGCAIVPRDRVVLPPSPGFAHLVVLVCQERSP